MHLLAREEMGLRCLLRVASLGRERTRAQEPGQQGAGTTSIGSIAAAEGLSFEYTAKLLRRLRIGGLVTSRRGATGGYCLARNAGEISVWDAIRVLDDDFIPSEACECQPDQRRGCARTTRCAVLTLWRRVGLQVRQSLEAISLEDLCQQDERLEFSLLPTGTAAQPPIEERGQAARSGNPPTSPGGVRLWPS